MHLPPVPDLAIRACGELPRHASEIFPKLRSAGSDIHGSGNVCVGQGAPGEAGVADSTYIRNVNTTEQTPAEDVAFVAVRLSDGRLCL